jgi:hypothetical protein
MLSGERVFGVVQSYNPFRKFGTVRRNSEDFFLDLRNREPHALLGAGSIVSFVAGQDVAGRAVARHVRATKPPIVTERDGQFSVDLGRDVTLRWWFEPAPGGSKCFIEVRGRGIDDSRLDGFSFPVKQMVH